MSTKTELRYDTPEKREQVTRKRYDEEREFEAHHAFRVALRDHAAPLEARLILLEREREELVKLVEVAACPNCDGRGWYAQPTMPDGEPEQVQCQFCDERSGLLSRIRSTATTK